MPTMSYCAIENTLMDLGVCDEVLRNLIHNEEPIGEYEQDNLRAFINACREIVELYEQGLRDGVIDKNGRLQSEQEDEE